MDMHADLEMDIHIDIILLSLSSWTYMWFLVNIMNMDISESANGVDTDDVRTKLGKHAAAKIANEMETLNIKICNFFPSVFSFRSCI